MSEIGDRIEELSRRNAAARSRHESKWRELLRWNRDFHRSPLFWAGVFVGCAAGVILGAALTDVQLPFVYRYERLHQYNWECLYRINRLNGRIELVVGFHPSSRTELCTAPSVLR